MRRAAGILLVVSAPWYVVAEAVAATAWREPPYSYAHNYISDLGAPGPASTLMGRVIDSPLAWVMNAGFIGHGVLALAAAVLLCPQLPHRWWLVGLASAHAVGIALVGTVHGSAQSIADGTFVFHSLGANLAIVGGNLLAVLEVQC
jgi:hypothetical membrane protein